MTTPIIQNVALNVNFTTPKTMSNNAFIPQQIYMLHWLMASRTITGSEKGIRLRTVESFGHLFRCLQSYKLFQRKQAFPEGFRPCRSDNGSVDMARVSERKRRPLRVCLRRTSPLSRVIIEWGDALAERRCQICGLQDQKPEILRSSYHLHYFC